MSARAARRVSGPAGFVLLAGLVVLLVRPALPIDETRYLQILSESTGPWLLRLEGQPYADKPPLLFWLARLAGLVGVPEAFALRAVPACASAATVLALERLARRVGIAHAGWLQAGMLMPLLFAQFLLFDPLLASCVWWAVACWAEERDAPATAAAAAALLAKGPVALVFLIPLAWAVGALRRPGRRRLPFAQLGLALLPLAGWALLAAASGDAQFQRELLWDRWAGRVQQSFAHQRGPWFYVPILLLGALPVTPLLALRRVAEPRAELRTFMSRLDVTLVAVFLAFSAISGKQPHYLLPLLPIVALRGAWVLERVPRAQRWLRAGALIEAGSVGAAFAALLVLEGRLSERYGRYADLLRGAVGWDVVLLAAGLVILAAAWFQGAFVRAPRARLGVAAAGLLALALPVHYAAGRLTLPREIGRGLADAPAATSLAVLGSSRDGLFAWLAGRDDLEHLSSVADTRAWCAKHPAGLLVLREKDAPALAELPLELVSEDRVNGKRCRLVRVVDPATR